MTAEIVIMNKLAVALAADSAATVLQGNGQKIFNTTNKLFTLSKYHPIGVMVYGGADINGVPWETVIKSYRQQIGTKAFTTVRECAKDFLEYVETRMFPPSSQENYFQFVVRTCFSQIRNRLDGEVKKVLDCNKVLSAEEIESLFEAQINKSLQEWNNCDFIGGYGEEYVLSTVALYSKILDEAYKVAFEKHKISEEAMEKLRMIPALSLAKKRFRNILSGVVVAGFGESELFPCYVEFNIEGVSNNKLKYVEVNTNSIGDQNEACIHPLAQKEVVIGFMEGVEPDLRDLFNVALSGIIKTYTEMVNKYLKELTSGSDGVLESELTRVGDEAIAELKKSINKKVRTSHVDPIIEAVRFLPKDELAAMAESLVNLTSFKRRISMGPETVGGPIDVAVISKGDGFVWIKRKHYFRPELNTHFFENYFRSDKEMS